MADEGTREAVLHEFIRSHRDAILARALDKMKLRVPDHSRAELGADIDIFMDEMIAALERDAGLPSTSPLPKTSKGAARVGLERRRAGLEIHNVVFTFGVISEAVGEIGAEERLSFSAKHYKMFNQCVDAGVATAITSYWVDARDEQEHAEAERLGALAHELRNALASATMAFEVIRQGEIGIRGRTGDIVAKCFVRMRDLIDLSLAAARLQAGARLAHEPLELGTLLRDVVAAAVRDRGVEVAVEVRERIDIEADERLLTSALGNVVQNALKFTRDGGLVQVRAAAEGDEVRVQVEDECGGLTVSDPQTLFAPFQRGGSGAIGAGLGLSIARDAVRAHGGDVSVKDLPGKGCIFELRFPRRLPAEG